MHVDLAHRNFVVLGPPMSGRSTTLATIALGLRASSGSGLHLAVLGGRESPLASLDVWDGAGFTHAAHTDLLAELVDILDGTDAEPRVALFVDTAEELEGTDVVSPLDGLLLHEGLRAAVACEPVTLSKAYSGWLAALRRNRTALLLQPESTPDVETAVNVRPRFRPEQDFPPERGILIEHRHWSLIQVGYAVR